MAMAIAMAIAMAMANTNIYIWGGGKLTDLTISSLRSTSGEVLT